jgi:hypothetical protein
MGDICVNTQDVVEHRRLRHQPRQLQVRPNGSGSVSATRCEKSTAEGPCQRQRGPGNKSARYSGSRDCSQHTIASVSSSIAGGWRPWLPCIAASTDWKLCGVVVKSPIDGTCSEFVCESNLIVDTSRPSVSANRLVRSLSCRGCDGRHA